jgi:hypothetical protein
MGRQKRSFVRFCDAMGRRTFLRVCSGARMSGRGYVFHSDVRKRNRYGRECDRWSTASVRGGLGKDVSQSMRRRNVRRHAPMLQRVKRVHEEGRTRLRAGSREARDARQWRGQEAVCQLGPKHTPAEVESLAYNTRIVADRWGPLGCSGSRLKESDLQMTGYNSCDKGENVCVWEQLEKKGRGERGVS